MGRTGYDVTRALCTCTREGVRLGQKHWGSLVRPGSTPGILIIHAPLTNETSYGGVSFPFAE